jgi:hypothetical protein
MFSEKIILRILPFLWILISFNGKAQETSNKAKQFPYKINIVSDSVFVVEFTSDKMVRNLLVTVFDPKGDLVFMDCQYNFIGPYKKSIRTEKTVKNNYHLKIASDNELFDTKLGTD